MKFTDTPILDTLKSYLKKIKIRLHVPFHNGIANNSFLPQEIYNLDISEITGFDLEGSKNPIYQSEKITAKLFGVSHSFYLTNGASQGILASLLSLSVLGKNVIVARNVHKSVINGLILSGLNPIWVDVDFNSDWGIFSAINISRIKKAIEKNKNIAGGIITSPTYEGVISGVKEISKLCHLNNIPLIVDEAHGGHFDFCDGLTSSVNLGADLVIQSWHKSLGSLTQTGVLHLVNKRFFDYKDIKRNLDLVSSTSPSFLLLISLELTRKYLLEDGKNDYKCLIKYSNQLKKEILNLNNIDSCFSLDPLKILLKHKFLTAEEFSNLLYEKGVEVESVNNSSLLILLGRSLNENILQKIKVAICEIDKMKKNKTISKKSVLKKWKQRSNPRLAFIKGEDVHAPCPPGYAINVPGVRY